jgi:hypothetical protein
LNCGKPQATNPADVAQLDSLKNRARECALEFECSEFALHAGKRTMSGKKPFSFGGFMTGVGLSATCAVGLLVLKQCAHTVEQGGWIPWTEFVSISSICLLCGVWFGWSANRSLAVEGARCFNQCKKGKWLEVFGFACSTAFAGMLLGITLSFPKWFYMGFDDALMQTLLLSGAAGVCGFVGGFGAQFAPVGERRAA